LTRSSRLDGGATISGDADKSDMKSWMLMELSRRKDRVIGGGDGGTSVSKEERRAKWSDGVAGRTKNSQWNGKVSRSDQKNEKIEGIAICVCRRCHMSHVRLD
jgi:hypothetical protein